MSPKIRQLGVYALLAAVLSLAIPAPSSARIYAAPTIESVALVGNELTITGSDFGAAPVVVLGDSTLTIVKVSATEIVAHTPALAAGIHILSVASRAGAPAEETATSSVHVQ